MFMKYDKEFLNYIDEILNNKEFLKRKNYNHHVNESVYDHSLKVAYCSYLFAKKHNLNKRDIYIGAILHDFYYKPWQDSKEKRSFFKQHGFVHAREALENSRKHFPHLINDRVENIILRHMFPLNITPPKYKETWVVTLMDKKCSLNVFKHPKEWPKYIGIKRKVKK